MDYPDYTTEHQKGKHLTYEEYVKIQVRLQDGWSANRIAVKELHCSPNTVRKIIRQGMTPLYHGKVQRFKAKTAWQVHKENLSRCCRTYKAAEKKAFLSYVESHFCGDDKWSLDACVGYALAHNLFKRSEMLCTKTLYNYVELGLLGIKNIDLPQKLHRRSKAKRIRERKRVLGRSIEERPESVDSREEFGHWEIDEVIGRKSDKDNVLLTMVERKTRNLCVLRLSDKFSRSLMEAFQRMEDELGQDFPKVFRSITADNGSENAILADIESVTGTPVYFTHPYTSCEKGTIENHNGLIRRFLPKGKRIDSYVTKAAYVVLGITMDGRKDILGVWIGEHESSKFWLTVLNDLKSRGVLDVYLFCTDGLCGMMEAIRAVYPKSRLQRCIVHQIRSSTKYVSYKDIKKVTADLKKIYTAVTMDEAEENLRIFANTWRKQYPSCVKSWEDNWEVLSTFFEYPPEIRKIIYTTNIIEGLNRQFRQITKNKPSFTNDDSLRRMLYLASQRIVKHWHARCQNWDMVLSQLDILFADRKVG